MAHINRYLHDKILRDLAKQKIVIVYGARQVGKTTLANKVRATYKNTCCINGDFVDDRAKIAEPSRTMVKQFSANDLLIVDEAQRIPDIGIKLKVIHDTLPQLHILVTGSSALEISQAVSEPLTGRSIPHRMYPLGMIELTKKTFSLPYALTYGTYPEVTLAGTPHDKEVAITNIATNYLFKDVLNIEYIKSPRTLEHLLTILASQMGSEVSIHELSNTLDIDSKTVNRYLDILEKLSIVFPLAPYATNVRKSVTKKRKYYFYDLGIRNALLHDFSPIEQRADIGALWENFCILERKKRNDAHERFVQYRFWRAYTGEEIDLLEIENTVLRGFECKWQHTSVPSRIKTLYQQDLGGADSITIFSAHDTSAILSAT